MGVMRIPRTQRYEGLDKADFLHYGAVMCVYIFNFVLFRSLSSGSNNVAVKLINK